MAVKGGIKYDEGKIRWVDMIRGFHDSLEEMVKIYNFGAIKHGLENWKLVEEKKYIEAADSHLRAIIKGKDMNIEQDKEGIDYSFFHAAHLDWNALALTWFALERKDKK